MDNFKKICLIFVCVLLLNGCVKMHSTMTINSDKSMIYENELLVSEKMGGNSTSEIVNETEKEELAKNGFTIESVPSTNGYYGIKISKKFDNIDDLSTNNGEEVMISDLSNDDFDTAKIFKVEKGFFKNTYTANFKYSTDSVTNSASGDMLDGEEDYSDLEESNDISMNAGISDEKDEEMSLFSSSDDFGNTTTIGASNDSELDMSGYGEMMSLMGEMEFTYVVNLPTKAISHNASSVENDGKRLKWNLATDKVSEINFSFALTNMTNIILVCGGGLLVLIVIIAVVVLSSKKKKEVEAPVNYTENTEMVMPSETEPAMESTKAAPAVETAPEVAPVEPAPVEPTPVEEPTVSEPAPLETEPVVDTPTVEPTVEEPTDSNNQMM